MKKGKICLITTYAPAYRSAIYTKLSQDLSCDFIIGKMQTDIKRMDYGLLSKSNVSEVKVSKFLYMSWQHKTIKQLFKSYENYILLGQINYISTWLFLLIGKLSRKKIFLWSHGWYGKESLLKRIIKKCFFRLADGVFVYGDYAIDLMVKEGINKNKLYAIHNSLDYDKQVKVRDGISPSQVYESHFNNTNPNLIFIGRLTKVKQLDMILECMRDSEVSYNLTYIGSGEDEQRLKQLALDFNLNDRVWFYGACYEEEELSQLIFNADLCVAPGNVGLTAIHCLTYGCPVVTHDNFPMQMPEFEVIKKGVTGDFFEYNNVKSLGETINNWFSSQRDREHVRNAAYQVIDKSWNPHYQIDVFKKTLA